MIVLLFKFPMLSSLSRTFSSFQIQHAFVTSPHVSPFSHCHSNINPIYRNTRKKYTLNSQQFPADFPFYPKEPDALLNSTSLTQIPVNDSVDISIILISWLRSCSNLEQVKGIHGLSVRLSQNLVRSVANDLIYAYVRFNELDAARKVFDNMSMRDVVSYTMLLEGYRSVHLDNEVIKLFNEMIDSGIRPNSYTFVCLLKRCGEQYDFNLGMQLHACVIKGDWINLFIDSVLVYFYAQCGDLLCACKVFDRMSVRDVIAWTTIITAHVQHGQGKEAFRRLSCMQNDGFAPNEFTTSSVLKACTDEKLLRYGVQLHGIIAKGLCRDDVYVSTSLLAMYARCGQITNARLVFDQMPKRNSITWTSMIFGYAQHGLGREAIWLFKRMMARRVLAFGLTILGILYACGSVQSLHLVKEIHTLIIKNCWSQDIRFSTTLLWVYCKCREYGYAEKILEVMPSRDTVTWTAMISGYSQLGYNAQALELLVDMLWDGVEPNDFTYSSVIGACAKLESVQYGRLMHAFVKKTKESLDNVFVGSSLLDMYMRCGNVRDAQRVFDTMLDRNFVTWKLLVMGYANNGRGQEALNFMHRMQEEGFGIDEFVRGVVISSFGEDQSEMPINSFGKRQG
ncbi:hypothetical protein LUZ60_017600 [Juncus effusus]|nr:hypothetical protein LUZ60_017600 [Juncus effusus]